MPPSFPDLPGPNGVRIGQSGVFLISVKPFIFWKDNAIQKNIFFEHVEILQSQGKYFATQFAKSRG